MNEDVPAAQPPPRSRTWIAILAVLLFMGGCGALATYAGVKFFGSARAPVDAANAFLDAARSDADAASHVCGGDYEPIPALAGSEGQRLMSVHVESDGTATVEGTITLDDAQTTSITLELRRAAGDWCVADLWY